MEYLDAYQAYVMGFGNSKQPPAEPVKWKPPSLNRYKINMDGAVFKEQRMASVGILIRDAEGQLIGACSRKLEVPLGAIEAEAKAVELGLMFARDLSIQDFTFESDSLTLINAVQDLSPPPSSVAVLVFSSVAMSHSFRCVDFSHVGRNGNRPQPIYLQNML